MTLLQISTKALCFASLLSVASLGELACASQPKQANTSALDVKNQPSFEALSSLAIPSSSSTQVPIPEALLEYTLDVSKTANPHKIGDQSKVFRLIVRFETPDVEPERARDAYIVNRTLWQARKEITQCFYQASHRQIMGEKTWAASIDINTKGSVTKTNVETANEWLSKMPELSECIFGSVKKLSFQEAQRDSKVRFRLKLNMIDATGRSDIKSSTSETTGSAPMSLN